MLWIIDIYRTTCLLIALAILSDIEYPALAKVVLAEIPINVDPLSPNVISFLDDRLKASVKRKETPIKAIILCNPHNPIPKCYPKETIEGYIALAKKYKIHLIVDEVFAYTVFPTKDTPNPQPFISVLSLNSYYDVELYDNIHILSGPTKDLGCSGLKSGILISRNDKLLENVRKTMMATPINGITDSSLSELLSNKERLQRLLNKNKVELTKNMDLCANWCKFHKLPYIGANAGVYFILDLSPIALKYGYGADDLAIKLLMKKMISDGVYINPTSLDADPLPCRFRFIVTQRLEILKLALARLEKAFDLDHFEVAV
ncbi:uncharacterized protein L201_007952 [Kwoniella dendrophila CBS 6074]|uniref:Aminotransferase class I/classII large domain-containing protein n=1 Tax=Kwoniella dendrophila CBS 6074 TaxID=1295534 RepID=A0AAX4K7D0_9TREE